MQNGVIRYTVSMTADTFMMMVVAVAVVMMMDIVSLVHHVPEVTKIIFPVYV